MLTAVFCDPLASPSSGGITQSNGDLDGSVATYTCDMNYELQGSVNRTCEVTGSTTAWSGSAPTCMASKSNIKCRCHALEMTRCARCFAHQPLLYINIIYVIIWSALIN